MEVVGGSIPLATTNSLTDPFPASGDCREMKLEALMLKLLGITTDVVF